MRAHGTQYGLILTNHICKEPTSKDGHIYRCQGLGLQCTFGRGRDSTGNNIQAQPEAILPLRGDHTR